MTAQAYNKTTLALRVQWTAPAYTTCVTAGAVSPSPSGRKQSPQYHPSLPVIIYFKKTAEIIS